MNPVAIIPVKNDSTGNWEIFPTDMTTSTFIPISGTISKSPICRQQSGLRNSRNCQSFIEQRKKNFVRLFNALEKYSQYVVLPSAAKDADPGWFGFPLLVRDDAPFCRWDLVEYLEDHKIATRMLFGGNLT